MDKNDSHRYDDMIDLEHHVSDTHPKMPLTARAVQFAPFAALTGYDAAIRETARLTDDRIDPGDSILTQLNKKLCVLQEHISDKPSVSITHFIRDKHKSGGSYETITGNVKKIQEYERTIVMLDGTVISMDEILEIDSDLFNEIEFL